MKNRSNHGFILFEALIAMTIVVSSGLGLVDIYQRLQGQHLHLQDNKTKQWAQASAYEMQIKASAKHPTTSIKSSSSQPTSQASRGRKNP